MSRYDARVQIRWADLDAQQHVNNTLYADYLETARAQWLTDGPAEPLLREGAIVVRHEIEYLEQMEYSTEPLNVAVGVVQLGGARFVLDYELTLGGTRVAHARSVMCPFDFTTGGPRRLTPVERAYLSEFRTEAESLETIDAPALEGRGTAWDLWTRWSDMDLYGHVNNVRFLDYAQEARLALGLDVSPVMTRPGMPGFDELPEAEQEGRWLLARMDVDYIAQVRFRTTPHRVLTAPVKVGESAVTFVSELIDPTARTDVLARVTSVIVHGGPDGEATSLPDDVRQRLEELVVND